MDTITSITEQSGCSWSVMTTGIPGDRALWIFRLSGVSQAMPNVIGFYAKDMDDACYKLNN